MRKEYRAVVRRKLDEEQRGFRMAAKHKQYGRGWLREVRQALGIPVEELTRKLKIHRSVIFRCEKREEKQRISLWALDQLAMAMDCELVYSIVPRGKTLVEMAEEREWDKRLRTARLEKEMDGVSK